MKKIVYGVLTGFLLIVAVFVFLNVFFSSLALITGSNRLRLSYLNRKYPIISSREIKPLDRCCIMCYIPLIGFICREIPTDEQAVHHHCIEDWIKLLDLGIYSKAEKEVLKVEQNIQQEEEKEPEMEIKQFGKPKVQLPGIIMGNKQKEKRETNSKTTTNPNSINDLSSVRISISNLSAFTIKPNEEKDAF